MSQRIDVSLEGLHQLQNRIDQKQLAAGDWPVVNALVSNLVHREEGKVERILAKLAAQQGAGNADLGNSSDHPTDSPIDLTETLSEDESESDPNPDMPPPKDSNTKSGAKPGHGRNGAPAYTNATHFYSNLALRVFGSICKVCKNGRMKRYRVKIIIRIVGQPMFGAELYHAEQARCSVCGQIITAQFLGEISEGVGKATTYHWTACAMLIVLHYTGGMPFKRLESLHESWGIPLADSNQWEVVNQSMDLLLPLLKAIENHGIQKALNLKIDDTGSMVLELQKQILAELEAAKTLGLSTDSIRTGINATCARIETSEAIVVLFFTGLHHAGEIIDQILSRRRVEVGKIIKITDAASKNFTHHQSEKLIESVCNAHGYLKFYDVKDKYPVEYAIVGEAYKHVFENDDIAKERKMSPSERLGYHQKYSRPWMEKIKKMCVEKLESRLVEPRSPLWEPITFVINQWPRLTRFLEVEGVPLDTNLVEQNLIIPVRYLAGSFNYQTVNGSEVGDIAMSLTATARANNVEPVAYLTYCLTHHKDLKKHPEKYLPWNYRDKIKNSEKPPPEIAIRSPNSKLA